jgi:hypothetical protein
VSLTIFRDIAQNSPEWEAARCGIVTASVFSDVLAKGQGKTRRTLLYKLAGERITGKPAENYRNGYMDRGHETEDQALAWLEMTADITIDRVGFIRCDERHVGCSPDGLIGEDGGAEAKSVAPHLLIPIHESGEFPSEHKAQIQGSLWVTGRKYWECVAFFPGMPPFKSRAVRDEPYIAALAVAVKEFNEELDALVRKYK